MKNLLLSLNIILVIAVGYLFYQHFKKPGQAAVTETTSAKAPVVIDLKPSSIVYINSDSLWSNYQFVKDIKKQLEKERASSESQFQAKYEQLEKEANEFRDKAQFMSQDQGMKAQQDLMEKEQKLGEWREEAASKLLQNENEKNNMLQNKITEYLKRNYSNSNYTYILGYSAGGGILYANDSLDITTEVINGLNAEYTASQKKK